MSDNSSHCTDDTEYLIQRFEEALELQQNTEGEIASTPTVAYCLECDEIAVDERRPDECLAHKTVSSDGYEHGGIQSAITVFRFLHTETNRSEGETDG